jgi:hypothetical protein
MTTTHTSAVTVAAYRALMQVLRSAVATGRGPLDSIDRVQQAQDFFTHMDMLRAVVGPVLALLAQETRLRHTAEIEREQFAGALAQATAALARRDGATEDAAPDRWLLVERAGVQVSPGSGGWCYRVPSLADGWDGPYATPDAALAAAVAALVRASRRTP